MPKSKNNEQNDQNEQANLPEEQKVIEEEAEYEELETEDEITDAFNAQPSVEDKFFYALNYGMRNNMIKQSGKYISEKERMELGMPKDPTVTFDMKNDTNFQSEMEKKIVAVYYYSVADKFFRK